MVARRLAGPVVPALLALGAAVRALPFGGPFHLPSHADETFLAIPAIQVLAGALPASAGPEYFGAAPSYVLAAWFWIAGTSTVANDLFAYGISLLIFWTGWLVLRRFLAPSAALLGLAALAAPPLFFAQWSFTTSGTHPTLLVLGNLCLLATYRIFGAGPAWRRAVLVLGLLAGLGWWTNPLIVVYLAPFGLLAVGTGLAWRAPIGLFALGLLIGGLPGWLYELRYFPSARFALHQAGGIAALPFRERLTTVTSDFLPTLLGLDARAGRLWLAVFLLVAMPLWAIALGRAAFRGWRELAGAASLPRRPARGDAILWVVALLNVALVLATARSIGAYYLLPLYSVLPCWMGEALDWLRRRARVAVPVMLGGFMALHVWLGWHGTFGTTPPGGRRWAPVERNVQSVSRWLEEHGIQRVYWTDMESLRPTERLNSYEVTYLTGGRLVASDPWREHIVSHGRLVDAAVRPAIVTADPAAGRLRAGLQAIGVDVSETDVAGRRVLEPAPRFTTTFVPLPRVRWTVTASDSAERAGDLLDGDAATGWSAGGRQAPGQWLAVDLGAPELVTRVDLLAVDWQNVPAGLRVEVSLDARHWDTASAVPDYWGPLFFSEHHAFLKVRRGRVQAIFPPVRTRHVRIVDTASVAQHSWSGREVFAYGPGGPRPPVPRPGEITSALRREGIDFVYANHWLSAWVRVDSQGAIAAQESNINLNDSSRTEPDPTELVPLRLEPGVGLLLGADTDPAGVRDALAGQPVTVRERTAGPYRLLVLTPASPPRHLDKKEWRASASDNAAQASRAIDGDRRTQWVSRGPAGPEVTVTLDLGRSRDLRGVEVRPGLPGRDLRLAVSLDGTTWTPIDAPVWAGSLYWTGSELLRNGGPKWAVAFPRTSLRYLRLSPAGPLRDPWTLAEIEALE
ncbi:MAG TPA: discoidin domain-containing protein [Methylomirabilota bacterium]